MGIVLAGCVNCFTYVHDRYNDWRWNDQDEFVDMGNYSANSKPQENRTIHAAVIDKNEAEIRRLFNKDPSIGNSVNSSGESALHLACKLGYLQVVEVLLDCECTVNVCTTIGTAVHCVIKATNTGYLSDQDGARLIEQLAAKGCDVHVATDNGRKTALFYASELGSIHCMESLIKLGVPLNCQDYNGFTPLYMATIRGDLPQVCLLLRHRPRLDVNIPDSMGRTPLVASLITITNNFRYQGISSKICNLGTTWVNGCQDVQQGLHFNPIAIVEALLRAGANPNVMDNHHRTALVVAFVMLEMDTLHKNGSCPATIPSSSDQSQTSKDNHPKLRASSSTGKESIYAPLVRLLVLSGARFPTGWNKDYSNSKCPAWIRDLYEETQQARDQNLVQRPAKLIHLCRLAIRAHLAAVGKLHQVTQVPVPPNLRGYLEIRYI